MQLRHRAPLGRLRDGGDAGVANRVSVEVQRRQPLAQPQRGREGRRLRVAPPGVVDLQLLGAPKRDAQRALVQVGHELRVAAVGEGELARLEPRAEDRASILL